MLCTRHPALRPGDLKRRVLSLGLDLSEVVPVFGNQWNEMQEVFPGIKTRMFRDLEGGLAGATPASILSYRNGEQWDRSWV